MERIITGDCLKGLNKLKTLSIIYLGWVAIQFLLSLKSAKKAVTVGGKWEGSISIGAIFAFILSILILFG